MQTYNMKFMDSEYAELVPMDGLKNNAPMRIKELFKKYTEEEWMTTLEINELFDSKYFESRPSKWVAKPGAPQEIVDEIKQFYDTMESWKIKE